MGYWLCVSSAEQYFTTTQDVALWDQVVQADQFFLFALVLSNF